MQQRLAELPEDERAEVQEAAAVLRKSRAAAGQKLLPLTVKDAEE
jgi:hypothetical protein